MMPRRLLLVLGLAATVAACSSPATTPAPTAAPTTAPTTAPMAAPTAAATAAPSPSDKAVAETDAPEFRGAIPAVTFMGGDGVTEATPLSVQPRLIAWQFDPTGTTDATAMRHVPLADWRWSDTRFIAEHADQSDLDAALPMIGRPAAFAADADQPIEDMSLVLREPGSTTGPVQILESVYPIPLEPAPAVGEFYVTARIGTGVWIGLYAGRLEEPTK